jgi:hypothetical protein
MLTLHSFVTDTYFQVLIPKIEASHFNYLEHRLKHQVLAKIEASEQLLVNIYFIYAQQACIKVKH